MRYRRKKLGLVLLLICALMCLFTVAGCSTATPPEGETENPTPAATVTITFETGVDGLTVEAMSGEIGSEISAPASPQRNGYRFAYWALDDEPFEFGKMPEKDVTLTAVWTKLYTVTFDLDNGETFTAEYAAGEQVERPADPTREGFRFMGWYRSKLSYSFGEMPDMDFTVTAKWLEYSNLPTMFIDLTDKNGKRFPLYSVTKDAYVDCTISLTNTEEKFELDTLKASFKGRGNGSWEADKKGYKIKFDKKQSIFGREKNKHWVIIACANFDDITMSRNYLAYNMANEVFDNLEYTTPAYWIDVYVNNEYRGVYLLCEHVRVDSGRVDIESEYGVVDTGYLIEYDAYYGGKEGVDYFRVAGLKYAFTIHSPDPEDREADTDGKVTEAQFREQIAFIKDYVTRVYQAALKGDYATFSTLADADSFVDMYILHELFKNVDTGYSSFYLYKKAGGKLYAGPAWDFDATTSGATDRGDRSPQGIYVADSVQRGSDFTASELYIALYKTDGFQRDLRARWKELSPAIRTFLDSRLNDEVYAANQDAMGKNFALWKNKTQQQATKDWLRDVKALKQWLIDRIDWLDKEWN